MKQLFLILTTIITTITIMDAQTNTIYNFTMKTIDGKEVKLSDFKGKKIMIVNVASECGLTPQYAQLEELYKTYGPDKFVILGFPANNFGAQEPGTNEEIKGFCTKNYGVTFPMFAKISVKGDDIDPLYQFLTQIRLNGVVEAPVTWNFQKFLIDENGKLVDFLPPTENPACDKVIDWLQQ